MGPSDLGTAPLQTHTRVMRTTIWTLTLTLMMTACGSDGSESRIYTDADTGSEIQLDSGDLFGVSLESNPSTGYGWTIVAFEELDGVLELREERYDEPDTELVGAPGTQVFTFAAVGEGAGILRLEYVRSFDDPPVPERIVEFIVRVDGAAWPPG